MPPRWAVIALRRGVNSEGSTAFPPYMIHTHKRVLHHALGDGRFFLVRLWLFFLRLDEGSVVFFFFCFCCFLSGVVKEFWICFCAYCICCLLCLVLKMKQFFFFWMFFVIFFCMMIALLRCVFVLHFCCNSSLFT